MISYLECLMELKTITMMNNFDNSYSSSDNNQDSDSPDNLLMARLLRQEVELETYKQAYNQVYDMTIAISTNLWTIIDSLPEPAILYEIAELVEDQDYREYLKTYAQVIDVYKITLVNAEAEALKLQSEKYQGESNV